ncbi:MAG: hypothetical protein OEY14_03295 [Myxococcales bacterium]|nr:hypothetical protein [Myxococcales bacterium]
MFEHFGALGLQHMGALEALESGSLTPEAVVALLQSRLGSLDAQITDRMNEIQGRAADAMDLSGRLEKLRALESHIQAQGKKGKLSKDAEITLADGSTVTAEALLEQLGLQTLIKSNRISSEALGPQIEIVSARYKEINRENEQGMIELQSLTQQRQQVISLSTQLLSSIHQPLNQIINNIGR